MPFSAVPEVRVVFWPQKSLCPPLTENEKLTSLMPDGSLALIETVKVSPGATVFCETEIEVISGPSLSNFLLLFNKVEGGPTVDVPEDKT